MSRLLTSLNLTVVLAALGVVELVYHRAVARLLLPHGALSAAGNRFFMGAGSFLGHFAGILGLFVLLNALLARGNRRLLFPRPIQMSLIFIAVVFFFLATRGIVAPLGPRNILHLQISHAFLALFVGLGLWYRGDGLVAPLRMRLGASLFALPVLLGAVVSFLSRVSERVAPGVLESLARTAELTQLGAALLSPLLLARIAARGPRRIVGLACAVLLATTTSAAALWRFDLLQALVLHGLGFSLPTPLGAGAQLFVAFFVLAFSAAAYAITALLLSPGAPRLIGCGLLLVICTGHQAQSPHALVLSLAGLFALAIGIKRSDASDAASPAQAPPDATLDRA